MGENMKKTHLFFETGKNIWVRYFDLEVNCLKVKMVLLMQFSQF